MDGRRLKKKSHNFGPIKDLFPLIEVYYKIYVFSLEIANCNRRQIRRIFVDFQIETAKKMTDCKFVHGWPQAVHGVGG